ncbi:Myosin-H heavy chain [Cocos nucifera]|nr:Myosin-H heavy chain [Cocos nucifera]
MVLGLRSKNKKGASVHVDYIIHIQEIKPWPPSQSLKSVRSVILQWENGDHSSGSTNPVTPSLGLSAAEGKIEFNESFNLQVSFLREGSTKGNAMSTFQKNVLEFNMYEPRRDKTVKGQHLGSVVIDLAEHGIIKETVSVSIPVNCKRSFRNTVQPLLYVKIQPFQKDNKSSSSRESLSKEPSLDKDGKESVSALMNEEYAEEAEIASFTDDDVSSHSSLACSSSAVEANADLPVQTSSAGQQHHENTLDAADEHGVGALEADSPLQSVPAKDELRLVTTGINLNGAVINQNEWSQESSPEDLPRDSESLVNGNASFSTPQTSSLLILEKSDTSGTRSSSSLLPESMEEDIISRKDNESVLWNDKVEEVQEKMVDFSGKENIIENLVKKESTIAITDKIESTDTDFQEKLNPVTNGEPEQNVNKDGISQESQNGSIEVSSGHAADYRFVEANTEKKTENRSEEKTKQVQNHSVETDCLTDSPDNFSIASVATVQKTPVIQQHNYLESSRKTSFTSDLTVSNWRGFGERGNGNLINDKLKSMKLSVRSPPDLKGTITYGPSDEDVKEVDVQEDACNGINSATDDGTDDQESTSSSSDKVRHISRISRNGFSNNKVRELELRVELLEGELREAAAIEIGLYSIVAEHGSSSHKVHTPARRLSRLYIHASKQWSQERQASAARSAVSGLVVAAKACGNDVPRLTFWLSNSVVLRAIITRTIKSSDNSKPFGPYSTEHGSIMVWKKKSSPLKWESIPRKKEKFSITEEFDDWEDPDTFTSALEKIETWIFYRIVESVWWQTLTPHMQSASEDGELKMGSKKSYGKTPSRSGCQQANSSIGIWKKAFKDASERLCPVRAGGHECGCLPMLARLVMEQCVARLDVAMFNAILRESDDEIPTDPVSDPISDPKVLPIPSGKSSFGSGAQLKNAIGNWSRWLTDLFGMDVDDTPQNEDEQDDDRLDVAASFKSFHLLNALSDLLMLPKDMLLEKSIRKEVCPTFSASMIKRILDSFLPDEFCPDPIPDAVLKALDSEDPLESDEERIRNAPCNASPIIYSPPSVASVESIIGDVQSAPLLRRSGSSVVRKCHTSDDELDELDSPLASILIDNLTAPTTKPKEHSYANTVRYQLLREVWRDD